MSEKLEKFQVSDRGFCIVNEGLEYSPASVKHSVQLELHYFGGLLRLVAYGLLRCSLVFMLLLSTIGIIFQDMAVDVNFFLLRSRLVVHGVLFRASKRSLLVLTRLLRYGVLDFA